MDDATRIKELEAWAAANPDMAYRIAMLGGSLTDFLPSADPAKAQQIQAAMYQQDQENKSWHAGDWAKAGLAAAALGVGGYYAAPYLMGESGAGMAVGEIGGASLANGGFIAGTGGAGASSLSGLAAGAAGASLIPGISNTAALSAAVPLATTGASLYYGNKQAQNANDAVNTASATQAAATDKTIQLQRDQFEYAKGLNQPFFEGSLPGYYSYLDAITGKRQTYTDPATGKQVTTEAFNPAETDAYKWQQSQMEKNTGRTLRALGRSNSTYGMNVMADQNRTLAANEYDKQLGRLADLTNIAKGGASSLTGAGQTYSTNAGNTLTTAANNQANATLAGSQISQNNLYNTIGSIGSGVNTGINLYNALK